MTHNESLLQYVWKHKLFALENLSTTDGIPVEMIDVGMQNTDAGPDFFNAKIKIGDKLWAGNVEIHLSSADWVKHGHHLNPAYNSVILHVVEHFISDVFNEKNQRVTQMQITVPESVRRNADALLRSPKVISCSDKLKDIPAAPLRLWINSLAIERMERKTKDIFTHLQRYKNSWNETFYVLLSRNFGFGLNADAFERLALSLPFSYIQKHADKRYQVEALLFGQAGMLNNKTLSDDYFLLLKREYEFLKQKFSLKNLDESLFRSLRVRPGGFPQVRIAQLAALLQHSGQLLSSVLEIDDFAKLRLFFHVNASEYWQTHYSFGHATPKSSKYPGDASIDAILINTAVPMLFAYGKKNDEDKYCDRAFYFLESLKAERNAIITAFKDAGIRAKNAFESQALIQLKKEYCDKRKCLYCQIGHRLLKQTAP
ncbi:MAG: DUF2851 family protein [Dysgonamonadaceae bacterium]|jgi:hypothetical protein|nr:DUF2851 family protein [Dysgonamonadaceae bacterium]